MNAKHSLIKMIPDASVVPLELSHDEYSSGIWTCGYEQACADIKRIITYKGIDEIINQLRKVKLRIELERKEKGKEAVFMLNAQYDDICKALKQLESEAIWR